MQAVVMAGGLGTRLRPLTSNIPKPMVPMANRPMMAHTLDLLKSHQFNDLLVMLYYQPELITDYFGDGQSLGCQMRYFRPEVDLGTAGCVKYIEPQIKSTILVISADVLCNFDLQAAVRFHREKKALATMILTHALNPLAYGVVITDESGKITRFLEKPSWGEVFSDTINTGIYLLEPEVLKEIPEGKSFDFGKNLFPLLLEKKLPLYGYVANGYWKDVGDLTEYRLAHYDILDGLIHSDYLGSLKKVADQELYIGENTIVEEGVVCESKTIVGNHCRIESGVKLGRSVIGHHVTIGSGSQIFGSILWDQVSVGKESHFRESVLGSKTSLGDRVWIQVGAVVSDDCRIGSDAIVRANVKVWPHKEIEEGATLSTSLVWGERWSKNLFGAYGVTGLGNIEITPEFASKVGAAYGAYLGSGAYVVTSRDSYRASRMIKRAIISGLLSAGVRVGDLRTAPIPVVRYEIGKEGEAGGIHVRQSPFDPRLMDFKFFDRTGSDISVTQEKAIEQLFLREDFKRAPLDEVGELITPPRAQEYYRAGFLRTVDMEALRKSRYKIVCDYAHSSASLIFPEILGDLGIEVVALNAYLDTHRTTKNSQDFQGSLEQLSHIVTTLEADAGFLLDTGAEKVFLVDERGTIVANDMALVLVSDLVMRCYPQGKIGVPVNASSLVEQLAARYNKTVLRTRTTPRYSMLAAKSEAADFVGDGVGGFIFQEFQPAFDGMYAIVKILEMMSKTGLRLNALSRTIPSGLRVQHKKVPCAWDRKGRVMRRAMDEGKEHTVQLIDGVKIFYGDAWVLLLPDPDEAYFHIWTESQEENRSKDLFREYMEKIKKWQS